VLYSRHEIVELVQAEAPELRSLLIAIMYFASRGNPNEVTGNRYGLLQIDLSQAREAGFTGLPNELLAPETNVQLGAQLLIKHGLVCFCGRALAPQIPAILQLQAYLEQENARQVAVTFDVTRENNQTRLSE
jgi:hypothetical protein